MMDMELQITYIKELSLIIGTHIKLTMMNGK